MNKVLVTGANGFIGAALCLRLLNDGAAVRAMCRVPTRGRTLAEAGAEVVGGDIQDPHAVRRYAKDCDVVFHVAAVGNGSAARQYSINVQGTLNLLQAARECGAERFVHVSTVAIYGPQISGSVDEDYPQRPSPADFYGQTKAAGEQAVWNYAKKTGLPAVSVRPAFVYGPRSQMWSRTLYQICAGYPIPMLDGGSSNAHPIYIDDVVDLLVTAAVHPGAPGWAFNAAPDPAPTWREFLGYYATMAGNQRTINVPSGLISPLTAIATQIGRLSGQPVDLSGGLKFWASRATFCMARAAEVLGWKPKISLDEGMALTQPWLKGVS